MEGLTTPVCRPGPRYRADMHVALLGATGLTGTLVLDELLLQEHPVRALVRAEGRIAPGARVTTLVGDARDRDTLTTLLVGVDVVISAIGPRLREETLLRDTARALLPSMASAGVSRFVGISCRDVRLSADVRSRGGAVVHWLTRGMRDAAAHDRRAEYETFARSGLEWTLVRAARLVDGDETGRIEHDAHRPTRSSRVVRADLATFLVAAAAQGWYVRQAPFVATAPS